MSDPEVLPLDEPADGIMPVLIKRIARGDKQNEKRTLVVVEQDVPMAFRDDRSLRPSGKRADRRRGSRERSAAGDVITEDLAI